MSEIETAVERWSRLLQEHQRLADREQDEDARAAHLSLAESYRRLIASEATFATIHKMMHRAIEDDPE